MLLFSFRIGLVENRVDRTFAQHERQKAARPCPVGLQHRTVLGEIGRPVQQPAARNRAERRARRILPAEFHARKLDADFRGHQIPVTGQHVAAEPFAQESAAAGGDDNGVRPHFPFAAVQPAYAAGAAHAMIVDEQFKRGRLVENFHPGLSDGAAHQAHIFGPLQVVPHRRPVLVAAKRIAPGFDPLQILVNLVKHAVNPVRLRQITAFPVAFAHGRFPQLGVGGKIKQIRSPRRRCAARTQIPFVGEHHFCALRRGAPSGPSPRRPSSDHQHVRSQPPTVMSAHRPLPPFTSVQNWRRTAGRSSD